jgi:starvation-inducible DNA-binding protein
MLSNLVKGHEAISRAAKIGLKVAEESNDIVTVDLMTRRADISEKTAWMLRANL